MPGRAAGIFSALAAVVVVLALPATASAADPIEGVWSFNEGRVVVEPTGATTFEGTISQQTQFADCPHVVGERMWEITKTGENAYEGTHIWFQTGGPAGPGCRVHDDGLGPSTWELVTVDGHQVLRFCTTNPSDATDTRCHDLERLEPRIDELPPNEAFLACGKRDVDISLNDLIRTGPKRNKAKVAGFASSALAGTEVEIWGQLQPKVGPGAAAVLPEKLGSAAVGPAGAFAQTVDLPYPPQQIKILRLYVRSASGDSSKKVKLTRRTRLTKAGSEDGKTTIRGELNAPRAKDLPKVTIEQRVKCKGKKQWRKVAATRQKPNRTYAKNFPNPVGSVTGIFRARTRYAKQAGQPAKFTTATPYASVDLS